jgi:hypothetical protein
MTAREALENGVPPVEELDEEPEPAKTAPAPKAQ